MRREPRGSVRRDLKTRDPFEVLRVPRQHRESFLERHPSNLGVYGVQGRPAAKERSRKPAGPRGVGALERQHGVAPEHSVDPARLLLRTVGPLHAFPKLEHGGGRNPEEDAFGFETTHLPLGRLPPSQQVHEEGRVGDHDRPSSLRRRANRSRRFASMASAIASAAFRSTTPAKSVKDRRRARRRTTSLNDSPGRFDAASAWYASSEREIVRAPIECVSIDSVYIDLMHPRVETQSSQPRGELLMGDRTRPSWVAGDFPPQYLL